MSVRIIGNEQEIEWAKEALFAVEKDRLSGKKGCTLDEFDVYLDDVITDKDAVKFSHAE